MNGGTGYMSLAIAMPFTKSTLRGIESDLITGVLMILVSLTKLCYNRFRRLNETYSNKENEAS
jgi:hypothetical protein